MFKFNVEVESSRLDVFIVSKFPNLSRSFVSTLCDQSKVMVNDKTTHKTSTKVRLGDTVTVDYDESIQADIPEINLDVIYKDDDCLVVYKPEGVLTHSKGAFNPEATVSTFIRKYTNGMDDNRGGIVHRLDRVTSGLLICARNEKALTWLQKQFAERKTQKTYLAVVSGVPEQHTAIIDMPIERNPKKPQTFRVGPNGKQAKTKYQVLKTNNNYSLLELNPETGRTHQLRVHLSQIGHPIVGDVLYGGEQSDRTYLHAKSLELIIPDRQKKLFECSTPESFNNLVK